MGKNKFSVVIPTYTGAGTIAGCFDSILEQKELKGIEIVVVIDGPNQQLTEICKKYKSEFDNRSVKFKLMQFKKNKGRYEARLKGAKTASHDYLLFLDDRITFGIDYFTEISGLSESVVIPNVYEAESNNFISRTLYLMRKKVYGSRNFGTKFKSYYITSKNFEKSPKGTTSLWIKKTVFIEACKEVKQAASINKYTNEDTKLFRTIVDSGIKILKSGEQIVYYRPRAKAVDEIRHLYHRGPRFVDYYLKPGTRFFPVLLSSVIGAVLLLLLIIFYPTLILYVILIGIILVAFVSMWLALTKKDIFYSFAGLLTILVVFSLGIYRGLFIKFILRN